MTLVSGNVITLEGAQEGGKENSLDFCGKKESKRQNRSSPRKRGNSDRFKKLVCVKFAIFSPHESYF